MNNLDNSPILCPSDSCAYEELLLRWSDDAFFGDDEESLAAVYASEVAR